MQVDEQLVDDLLLDSHGIPSFAGEILEEVKNSGIIRFDETTDYIG